MRKRTRVKCVSNKCFCTVEAVCRILSSDEIAIKIFVSLIAVMARGGLIRYLVSAYYLLQEVRNLWLIMCRLDQVAYSSACSFSSLYDG